MTPKLEQAIVNGKRLGKMALYFGCMRRLGHFLHDSDGRSLFHGQESFPDLPWDEALMDGSLLANGKIPDIPTGKVYWTLGGADALWYAFYWWDRSVDKRGASNSGFYVRGFGWNVGKEAELVQAAFDYACGQFPSVVARQAYPLVLQVDWRNQSLADSIPASTMSTPAAPPL